MFRLLNCIIFYGVYADSDKLKVYNESINTQLRLSLSKSEFDYYNDLIKSANNNDEFQIEFYTDKDGKNLGYIESIQLVEKKKKFAVIFRKYICERKF